MVLPFISALRLRGSWPYALAVHHAAAELAELGSSCCSAALKEVSPPSLLVIQHVHTFSWLRRLECRKHPINSRKDACMLLNSIHVMTAGVQVVVQTSYC